MRAKVILLSCSLLFSLLLGEFIVRIFDLPPALIALNTRHKNSGYQISPNPILGYELKCNYRNANPSLHWGDFPLTNSHGQRDIERTLEKPAGVFRIILLGDSIVAGHGIRDLHHTISRELEQLIQQQESNVEVLNFGVGGYQTLAEIELFRTKGLRYSPNLVILVFESNDFNIENDDMWLNMETSKPVYLLLKKSQLFRFIAVRMNWFSLGDFQRRTISNRTLLDDSVEQGISKLKALSLEYNFDLMVVIWPRFSNIKKHVNGIYDFYPQGPYINNLMEIESICKKYNIDSYRLVSFFIEDYNNVLSKAPNGVSPVLNTTYTIGDTCHPNEYGSRVAARGLKKILDERLKGVFSG